jgi:hypothetical protein
MREARIEAVEGGRQALGCCRRSRFARPALSVASESFAADVKSETMAITDPGNPDVIGIIGTSS